MRAKRKQPSLLVKALWGGKWYFVPRSWESNLTKAGIRVSGAEAVAASNAPQTPREKRLGIAANTTAG